MAKTEKKTLSPKEKLMMKKVRKQKRRALFKSILAILLVLLMVGMALTPVFSQSKRQLNRVDDSARSEQFNFSVSQLLVSDRQIQLSDGVTTKVITTTNTKTDTDFHSYIDFMMETVQSNYFKDVDKQALIEGAYKGIFTALDPYSTYFTPKEYQSFNTTLEGEFSGIGVYITDGKSGFVEVVSPVKGTPADKAGLLPGDLIIEIDGINASGFTTEKASTLIRGEKGTHVILKIKRVGSTNPITVDIIRDTIVIKSVEYKVLDQKVSDQKIGYILVKEFGQKTNAEFDAAMAYMVNQNIQKIIVDVRNNPGGLLDSAIHLSDYFIPKGKEIVKIDYKGTNDRVYRANTDKTPAEVVVLINKGSASASEIFAGSIQQTGSGKVIGETSFGKGTVQSLLPLNNGGAVKMTIAEYKLANNYTVNGVGIVPSTEVKAPAVMTTEIEANLAPLNINDGQSSLNIYSAQQRLKLLGYTVTADGKLSTQTTAAIQLFQSHYQLKQSKILDSATMEALIKATKVNAELKYDPQLDAAIQSFK